MDRIFHLKENHTTIGRELLAGLVTFMAMAYIICVQPAILSGQMFGMNTGLEINALITTTCIASAIGSILMGFWANYPLALAPGMGENFFVVLTLMPLIATTLGVQIGDSSVTRIAMGVLFYSGVAFLLITIFRLRAFLFKIVSPSLSAAIGAGLGIFIALLGLKSAGMIVFDNDQMKLGSLISSSALIFYTGLFVSFFLTTRKIPGGVFFGMLAAGLVAYLLHIAKSLSYPTTFHEIPQFFQAFWIALTGSFKEIHFSTFTGCPADPRSVVGQIDFIGTLKAMKHLWPMLFILLFMDMFDTFGTLVGVARQGNLMQGNSVPRADQIFMADAVSTMAGAALGHSTVTSYLESTVGVAIGGRTGLTAITVGILFLLSLFFSPLIVLIANNSAITAAPLVFVGILMAGQLKEVNWDDMTESVPAFFTIVGIPFTGSIANGILLGLLTWTGAKALGGKMKQISLGNWILSFLLVLYIVFIMPKG